MGDLRSATAGELAAVPWQRAVTALTTAYRELTETLLRCDEADFAMPTRCAGWSRRDLLFHMVLDAQRALVTFATPHPGPPDTDYVTYWDRYWVHERSGDLDGPPANRREKAEAHARYVRAAAAAYRSAKSLLAHWTDTSEATVRAARAVPPDRNLAIQAMVLAVPDFMVTLVVEAVVHHLDLDLAAAEPANLDLVRRTLDGLLGSGAVRPDWDDVTYALKGTGRLALDPVERVVLDDQCRRFPLIS